MLLVLPSRLRHVRSHDAQLNAHVAYPYGAWGMEVQIAARYRGCLHGRLPVDCTHFKGDVLVAVGGYSHAGSVHVFEPLEGLKVQPAVRMVQLCVCALVNPVQQCDE